MPTQRDLLLHSRPMTHRIQIKLQLTDKSRLIFEYIWMFSFMTFCDVGLVCSGNEIVYIIRFHGSCTELMFRTCQRHHEHGIF